jgi:two-component system alkaline phosphatase synthesis response regulator PhoP
MDTTESKPRVLIIDDDASLRLFIKILFVNNGFDVSLAENGHEGIRLASMNPPNIIILDIMMEGLNGFEVCKLLRANSSMQRTAIIIISGKSFKPDIDKAMELGADAFIVKPYSPDELLKTAIQRMQERASRS